MSQTRRLLFLPPQGSKYQDDDWKTLCRSTPIPIEQIPRYLIDEGRTPGWLRPCVSCCWAIGEDKLLELAHTRYPRSALRKADGSVISDSIFYMVAFIRAEFNVPDEMEDCFRIIDAITPDGQLILALAVGNNYLGILPLDIIERMSTVLFQAEKPQWYLYVADWSWRRKD